jgi:hypothetical protein
MCAEEDCKNLSFLTSKSTLNGKASGVVPPVSATGLACIALQK